MKLRVSPAARADLRSIWRYTARTWSIQQADSYVQSIDNACRALADGSARGRSAQQYREGFMHFPVGSHFIFYKITSPDRLDVIRILHQQMDIPARLRD